VREELPIHNFADEKGMIPWRIVFTEHAIHIAEALFQDGAPRFTPYPLCGGELRLGIRPFEPSQEIRLVSVEKMQGKTSAFLN
jgi:hypothetical protein